MYPWIIDDFTWRPGESISGVTNVINPKDFPFHVNGKDFKTRAEAETYAKKRSGDIGDDVVILQRVAMVVFPIPDLKVEELVVS